MNSIFSAGLDKSALSKTINELGNKIEEWDKGDSRLKKKREFGLKFKQCIEFYVQYKMNSFMQSMDIDYTTKITQIIPQIKKLNTTS